MKGCAHCGAVRGVPNQITVHGPAVIVEGGYVVGFDGPDADERAETYAARRSGRYVPTGETVVTTG